MAWQPPSRQLVINAIFAYIVLPFITVLTIFINDFNSIKQIPAFFKQWANVNSYIGVLLRTSPSLIIISL